MQQILNSNLSLEEFKSLLKTLDLSNVYSDKNNLLHILASRGLDDCIEYLYKTIHSSKYISDKEDRAYRKEKIHEMVNNFNNESMTPLQEASCEGYVDCCAHLIQLDSSINIQNHYGNTSLHYAIYNGHEEVVKLLLSHDADLYIENFKKMTPYKLIFKHMKSMISVILEKNKKVIARVSSDKIVDVKELITNKKIIMNRIQQTIHMKKPFITNCQRFWTLKCRKIFRTICCCCQVTTNQRVAPSTIHGANRDSIFTIPSTVSEEPLEENKTFCDKMNQSHKELCDKKDCQTKVISRSESRLQMGVKKILPNTEFRDSLHKIMTKHSHNQIITSRKETKQKNLLVQYDYHQITNEDITEFISEEVGEVIQLPWFQILMEFYWISFAKDLFLKRLLFYIFYIILFYANYYLYNANKLRYLSANNTVINYTNYTYSWNQTLYINQTNQTNPVWQFIPDYKTKEYSYDYTFLALSIILFIINTFYFMNEIIEMKRIGIRHIGSYCKNKWNVFDNLSIILVYMSIILQLCFSSFENVIISIIYPLFFIKLLNFASGFRKIGPFIRVIFRMIGDIMNFLIVMVFFIIGFSQSFYTLLNNDFIQLEAIKSNHSGNIEFAKSYEIAKKFQNPILSIVSTFDIPIIGLDLTCNDYLENLFIFNVLYRIYYVISVILLLNMLIAILENSYNNIITDSENEWRIERSKMILSLMNHIFYKQKHDTVTDFDTLYSLEQDEPVKGIENFKLMIES